MIIFGSVMHALQQLLLVCSEEFEAEVRQKYPGFFFFIFSHFHMFW